MLKKFIEENYFVNPNGVLPVAQVRRAYPGGRVARPAFISELVLAGFEIAAGSNNSTYIVGWSAKEPRKYVAVDGRLVHV